MHFQRTVVVMSEEEGFGLQTLCSTSCLAQDKIYGKEVPSLFPIVRVKYPTNAHMHGQCAPTCPLWFGIQALPRLDIVSLYNNSFSFHNFDQDVPKLPDNRITAEFLHQAFWINLPQTLIQTAFSWSRVWKKRQASKWDMNFMLPSSLSLETL